MDKPICRLCNKKHYSHEPHQFDMENGASIVVKSSKDKFVGAKKSFQAEVPKQDKKPKFDRVAYQREYMRKRRAKK